MVHALPFLFCLHVMKIIVTSIKTLRSKKIHRNFRAMVEYRSSVIPLKREWVEAQGRKNSQLGKITQLLE